MRPAAGGLKIAVIGAGAAGITAACLLQEGHEVTLYEKSASLGGHAHGKLVLLLADAA